MSYPGYGGQQPYGYGQPPPAGGGYQQPPPGGYPGQQPQGYPPQPGYPQTGEYVLPISKSMHTSSWNKPD